MGSYRASPAGSMAKKKGGGGKNKGKGKGKSGLPETRATGGLPLDRPSSFKLITVHAPPVGHVRQPPELPVARRQWLRLPYAVMHAIEVHDSSTVFEWLAHDEHHVDAVFDAADGSVRNYTMLMLAALCGHEDLVVELVRRGATAGLRNSAGASALVLATVSERHAIAQLLLEHGADLSELAIVHRGKSFAVRTESMCVRGLTDPLASPPLRRIHAGRRRPRTCLPLL